MRQANLPTRYGRRADGLGTISATGYGQYLYSRFDVRPLLNSFSCSPLGLRLVMDIWPDALRTIEGCEFARSRVAKPSLGNQQR